jgi:putative ABC transport system permease protein
MTFRDTLDLALRNLRQAKLRSFLTMLGVSIGIASLAGMVSLGVGLQDQFVGRFTRSGMFDSVTVMPGNDRPGVMMGGRGLGGPGMRGGGFGRRGRTPAPGAGDEPARQVTDEALKDLAALEHVRDVYPSLRVPVEVKYGGESEFAAAAAVPMSVRGEGAFQSIPYGRFFASDTETACMVSLDMAKRIDEKAPASLVGKALTLNYATSVNGTPQRAEIACPIVGIVERETGPFAAAAGVAPVMIPMGKAREMYAASAVAAQAVVPGAPRSRIYPAAVVRVSGAQSTQDVEDRIKRMGFAAYSVSDALQGAKRAFIILDIVLSLIGSIALAVSSLGIMNTMVMSILERTREIGIMKAIGGSDGDIRRIFLIEASAIGFLGGVAGVMLGWAVGRAINFGANIYIEQQGGTPGNLFSLPFWLIGGAIGFSIAVSLLAGSYPAARAARLDPIQALRHD